MKKVIEVKEQGSDICPYCNYTHEPTEGYSEMHLDGRCEIICAKCGEMYFYNSNPDTPHVDGNGTLHMPHSAFAKNISTYNSGGGCMLDEIELDTGELLIISDDAIGIYDSREVWEQGEGYMMTMDRRGARLTSRCTQCNHIYRKDHDDQTVCPLCTKEKV